jgi:uncharacterized protein (DUF1919 family)
MSFLLNYNFCDFFYPYELIEVNIIIIRQSMGGVMASSQMSSTFAGMHINMYLHVE